MAPSVLCLGIPASSALVPPEMREPLAKWLKAMEADMDASDYDWEMFYVEPEPNMDFERIREKLKEREWDVIMIGMGVRGNGGLSWFFEKLVNMAHRQLPRATFAFNVTPEGTREAVERALAL